MTEAGDQRGIEASRANDRDFALPDDGAAEAEASRNPTTLDDASIPDLDQHLPPDQSEGQTARDILPEDDGIPEVAQDDSPTMQRAEDPQFTPLPGESPTAVLDWGTTTFEQSQGESLTGRLERELPDDSVDLRPAEDPARAPFQLEQDLNTSDPSDSGTNRTADDVEATPQEAVGGEGPEEAAMHIVEGT